jgi:hypothetical protein
MLTPPRHQYPPMKSYSTVQRSSATRAGIEVACPIRSWPSSASNPQAVILIWVAEHVEVGVSEGIDGSVASSGLTAPFSAG